MNYLAHAYLSFGKPDILVGNMISDFVKGRKKFEYPAAIQKGIMLHRAIDQFTDDHPVTKSAKEFFRPAYRLYSGAFIDVVYDHFLALDANAFKDNESLKNFTTTSYQTLNSNIDFLPSPFKNILPHMQQHDWLFNYQFIPGIEKSFGGLVRRAAYMNESATAFEIFNKNYDVLKEYYNTFFPDIEKFALQSLADL